MQWPVSSSSQTGPSGFSRINTEEGFEEYLTWDSTDSSLVSSRTHAQPEEEDPTDDTTEKERDEHFNTIQPMFPMKQEWRVKEKADTHAPTTSDDHMDLLDDDESLVIKDGPPPLINMVFTLPA
jgi:hypothetical protein